MPLLALVVPCSWAVFPREEGESCARRAWGAAQFLLWRRLILGWCLQLWQCSPNCCFHMAVVDGPAGTATKALHPAWCTRLFGGPILHPLQHRLLSLDSHAGASSSYQVPWLPAGAPRVSAVWDLRRQMQHLSSSVALSRLWVDLVPSLHKRKTRQKVFYKLTLGKVEMETEAPFGVANPLDWGQSATGYPAFSLSVFQLIHHLSSEAHGSSY